MKLSAYARSLGVSYRTARFMRRLPDARSASAGLELQPAIWLPRGKVVVALEPLPTVNQPGQHPWHSCL